MPNGCWEWQGFTNPNGYGMVYAGPGRYEYAHRFAYERTEGPIPDGLVAMHRCDNPRCVRPVHIIPGTQNDNVHDMIEKGRYVPRPRQTHCQRGHAFTPENVTLWRGHRRCRVCANLLRRKALAPVSPLACMNAG